MLARRVVTALVGIVFLIIILYYGGWLFDITTLATGVILMHEFYAAFRKKGFQPVTWLGYLFVVLFFFFVYNNTWEYWGIFLLLAVMTLLAVPVFYESVTPIDISITVLGFIYPGLTFLFLIPLKRYVAPYNDYLLVFTLFTTWATDTFAYFAGLKLGKSKLIPRVSPNKTVEGSLGGIVGSITIALIAGCILENFYNLSIAFYHYLIIGILCGFFAQIGDLVASAIKRYCGVKDYGSILPGHGGMLDRFDSLLFTVPIVYVYYLFLLAP